MLRALGVVVFAAMCLKGGWTSKTVHKKIHAVGEKVHEEGCGTLVLLSVQGKQRVWGCAENFPMWQLPKTAGQGRDFQRRNCRDDFLPIINIISSLLVIAGCYTNNKDQFGLAISRMMRTCL